MRLKLSKSSLKYSTVVVIQEFLRKLEAEDNDSHAILYIILKFS